MGRRHPGARQPIWENTIYLRESVLRQNHLALALREIRRIERRLFMLACWKIQRYVEGSPPV
jgi:hypothetical protein